MTTEGNHYVEGNSTSGTFLVRLAALAGMATFVLIIIISTDLLVNAPSATDSSQKIFSYLALHRGQLQASAVLAGLAAATVLVWLPGLFRALRIVEGGSPGLSLAAFGGGVLTAASMLTLALIGGTMGTRFNDLSPAGARVLWTMFLLSAGTMLVGLLVVIGATAVVYLRAQLFPSVAVASAVVALFSGVAAFTIGYPAIQVVEVPAIILDAGWIFIFSIYLGRDPALTALGPRTPDQADPARPLGHRANDSRADDTANKL